ncbi:MAG: ImmA/IrrE family metallo-endopeptidase [Clostridia bacterium]|nr:ImmA/IrrE family metallo-endopeptidase [Clostridia bacterium]
MSPEQLADLVRHTYSQCIGPPVDIASIARQAGIQVLQWPFADVELCGLLHWVDASPVIIVNSRHSWARRRFTLAHELWHYMVDMPSPSAALMLKRGAPRGHERDADHFAACLLMEADAVRDLRGRGVPADAVATALGVSKQALEFRFRELGLR